VLAHAAKPLNLVNRSRDDVPEVREEHERDCIAACAAPLCARGKVPAS